MENNTLMITERMPIESAEEFIGLFGLKEENISIMTIGPVIGAHVGPGFMAITYHGSDRIM